MPEIPALPKTCNLKAGLESPIPTLPANSAIETVASAFALIKGTPEISLTENIYPVFRTGLIENNCPCEPENANVLSSKTLNFIGSPFVPINVIVGVLETPVLPIRAVL